MNAGGTRERILRTALDLFASRGYSATSVADIAAGADLLKGNLSYHFRTKADVLEAVTELRTEELFAQLNRRLRPDMGPIERIHAFLDGFCDSAAPLARHGCPVGSLCSELGRAQPELRPYASRILLSLAQWLEQQFAQVAPAGEARDRAEHLLALCQGAAVLAHAYADPAVVTRQAASARAWLETLGR